MANNQGLSARALNGIRETAAAFLMPGAREAIEAERERMAEEREAMTAERGRLAGAIEYLIEARRYALTDESIARTLSETTDSRVVDLILAQRGWTNVLGTDGVLSGGAFNEHERRAAVGDSRWMDGRDVQTRAARRIWTTFGFGQSIRVIPSDSAAAQVWNEFFTARRNRPILSARKISELSDRLITDGELFLLVYISTVSGRSTLRVMSTEKIVEIIRDADDPSVALYYVQETAKGRVAYPDFAATQPQLDRAQLPEGTRDVNTIAIGEERATQVVVIHVALNERNGRGWPEMAQAHAWARAYRDFLQDRATIAASRASFVEKIKVKGGSRAIDNLQARLNSALTNAEGMLYGAGDVNAPAAAGSTWLENESVSRERLDLSTGASDARIDGLGLAQQFAAGAGIPAHFLGRTDSAQNRAVAREAGLPFNELIQSYQTFWIDVFTDLLGIVLWAAEEYGGADIADTKAQYHMDSPFEAEIAEIVSALAAVVNAAEKGFVEPIPAQSVATFLVTRLVSALGARDTESVVSPVTVIDAAAIESAVITGAADSELESLEEIGRLAAARRLEISEDAGEPADALAEDLPDEPLEVGAGLQITADEIRAAIGDAPRAARKALRAQQKRARKAGRK